MIDERGAGSVRRRGNAIAAVGAGLVLASCGGADEPPACENPQTATTVTMGDFFYEPACVEAPGGARLEVMNEGDVPHTFTVEGSDEKVEVDVPAGERVTLVVPPLAASTYRVICIYHPQMEAALRIT